MSDGLFNKIFRGAQKGASKAAGRVIDLFEQQADEQDREATLAEKTGATIGDFFEPQPIEEGVRIRDVVKEVPENFADVVGRPILRSLAAVGTKVGNLDPRATYIPETTFEKSAFGDDEVTSAPSSTTDASTTDAARWQKRFSSMKTPSSKPSAPRTSRSTTPARTDHWRARQ